MVNFQWDKKSPLKVFTFEQFKAILDEETKGAVEDKTVTELWNTYKDKDYNIQLIINKANADQREVAQINKRRTVVLLGSKDHTYSDKKTKDAGRVFQSFVTAWDFDEKALIKLCIRGSPRLKAKNAEWGKKCKIGTKISQTGQYTNEELVKVEEYVNDPTFNLEELFKSIYVVPEHLTKGIVDKHAIVCLYGEIGKISQIKTNSPVQDKETGRVEIVTSHEPPYYRTLDESGAYIPCFQFGIASPAEFNQNERKIIKARFRTQFFGRPVLILDGWDDKSARAIAQLDRKETEVDNSAIEEELNSMFGNSAYRVFAIGSLGIWSIYNETAYININLTYVVQTKFKPTKLLTKEESLARTEGKVIQKDAKAEVERLKEIITHNLQINDLDVTYEVLKEMGTFTDFDFNEAIMQRMVEKIRKELKDAKNQPKPAEAKPAEAKPAEAKPAEAKPAEAKPAEAKPAEAKPAEAKKESVPSTPKPTPTAKTEAKKDEPKIELTKHDIADIDEETVSIMEMVNDFQVDELMTMLKDTIRKKIGDAKFPLWKKLYYDKTFAEFQKQKTIVPETPVSKDEPPSSNTNDAEYENIVQTLKENQASDEAKQITEFIYKNDKDHTGVPKRDIIAHFRPTIPLEKINDALTTLMKNYGVITETQKNFFSVIL